MRNSGSLPSELSGGQQQQSVLCGLCSWPRYFNGWTLWCLGPDHPWIKIWSKTCRTFSKTIILWPMIWTTLTLATKTWLWIRQDHAGGNTRRNSTAPSQWIRGKFDRCDRLIQARPNITTVGQVTLKTWRPLRLINREEALKMMHDRRVDSCWSRTMAVRWRLYRYWRYWL